MNAPRDRRRGRARGRRPGRTGPRAPQGTPWAGRRLELTVEDVAHGGHCVARHEGRVVFVRHTLPGERVVATVTSGTDRSSFLRADATEVLDPAPQRRDAPCPVSGPGGCGGCDWQHTDAAFGRELKGRVVAEQLRRIAGLDRAVAVEAVPGDVDGLRWRTRLELAVGQDGRAGLRGHRSHGVVTVEDCLIATESVVGTGVLNAEHESGVRAVEVVGPSEGKPVVLPSGTDVPVVHERVSLDDHDLIFAVDADGFWQVHPGAARVLLETVGGALGVRPGERVVDLYSGVGLFAAELARAVGPDGVVTAVEGDRRATEHAHINLAGTSARAVHADVTAWALEAPELAAADVVVLDPPRTGAGREVTQAVLAGRPRAVAYVACDPAALARDLATAHEAGYVLEDLRAFDIFPMTHHVECVALLVPGPR